MACEHDKANEIYVCSISTSPYSYYEISSCERLCDPLENL